MSTIESSPALAESFNRYKQNVASGTALTFIAESHKSADRMNYEPMMTARQYGHLVVTIGKAASIGEPFDYAVATALPGISPYLNRWQAIAGIAERLSAFIRGGWEDTRTATSPEPGRPSRNKHDTTPKVALVLTLLAYECMAALEMSGASLGWALRDLTAENPDIERAVIGFMPHCAASLAKMR